MLSAVSSFVQAAAFNISLEGDVQFASTNPFGLSVSDTVQLDIAFEDSLVSPTGPSTVRLDQGANNGLDLVFGSGTFTEADDVDFGSSGPFGPRAFFNDGVFDGIEFFTEIPGTSLALQIRDIFDGPDVIAFFDLYDLNTFDSVVSGEFGVLANAPVSPVPVPAALPLFASALFGLQLLRRRKTTA